jgi:hypothetical protein
MWLVRNVAGIQYEYRGLVQQDTKDTTEEDGRRDENNNETSLKISGVGGC